jgi:hypothetical protein
MTSGVLALAVGDAGSVMPPIETICSVGVIAGKREIGGSNNGLLVLAVGVVTPVYWEG